MKNSVTQSLSPLSKTVPSNGSPKSGLVTTTLQRICAGLAYRADILLSLFEPRGKSFVEGDQHRADCCFYRTKERFCDCGMWLS